MARAPASHFCQGKRGFDSQKSANEAASLSGRRREGAARSSYKCPVCRKWHIGTHQGTRASTRRRLRLEQIRRQEADFTSKE